MTDFYSVRSQRGNVQTYNMKVKQEEGSGFTSHPVCMLAGLCPVMDGGSTAASHLEQTEAA